MAQPPLLTPEELVCGVCDRTTSRHPYIAVRHRNVHTSSSLEPGPRRLWPVPLRRGVFPAQSVFHKQLFLTSHLRSSEGAATSRSTCAKRCRGFEEVCP